MTIEQMEYMLTLEQEKKIYLAAKKCFISQSALSQQLTKIEKEAGFPLFLRENNQYVPTAEGRVLLDGFQKIMYIYKAAMCEARQQQSLSERIITLGMPSMRAATLFTYIYPRFKERFPGYELKLQEMPVADSPEMLKRRMIDFSIFSPAYSIPMDYQRYYTYYPVAQEELVLIAPQNHPFSKLAGENNHTLDLQLLNGENMALYGESSIVRGIIDSSFTAHHIQCRNIISFKSCNTIIQFVKKGLALSIIPHMFATADMDLTAIHLTPPITQEIGLLSLKQPKRADIEECVLKLMKAAFEA